MAKEGEWWQLLEVSKDHAKLIPAEVAGMNNFEAVAKLVEKYGKDWWYRSPLAAGGEGARRQGAHRRSTAVASSMR